MPYYDPPPLWLVLAPDGERTEKIRIGSTGQAAMMAAARVRVEGVYRIVGCDGRSIAKGEAWRCVLVDGKRRAECHV